MLGLRGSLFKPRRLMFGQNWGYFGGMLGLNWSMLAHFEALLELCWPIWARPSRAMLGLWQTAQLVFVSKTLLLPGTGIAKMPPEQVYVGLSWSYVGAMLAHLGSMFGPCSLILGLCWGFVDPPEVILG